MAMIGPKNLIRSDSTTDAPDFSAPSVLSEYEPVCGYKLCRHLCNVELLYPFAKYRVFVAILSVLGLLHGASVGYLVESLQIYRHTFPLPAAFIDWVLVVSELTQGLLALVISYWGGRSRRPGWIAVCVALQALVCFSVIVPYVVLPAGFKPAGPCAQEEAEKATLRVQQSAVQTAAMALLVLAQVGIGVANTSYLAHGLSFIDDNTDRARSPWFIGIAMALKHLGAKVGILFVWTSENEKYWWIGWPVLSLGLVVVAILLSMFPSELPATAVKHAAKSILNTAGGVKFANSNPQPATEDMDNRTGFWASLKRLCTNKMMILNVLATVCLQTGVTNFIGLEDKYLESVFRIPVYLKDGYVGRFNDPWISRLTAGLLKPPLVALSVVVLGFVISSSRLSARRVAAWNVIVGVVVGALHLWYMGMYCTPQLLVQESQTSFEMNYTCVSRFDCSVSFSPMCINKHATFYSHYHACCKEPYLAGLCTDKKQNLFLTDGMCDSAECSPQVYWVLYQVLSILAAALVGSRLVGNVILYFRCIQPQDKSMAIGLELTLVGIIAYVPGKLFYKFITDSSCIYWKEDGYTCLLHTPGKFGLYVNVTTACLVLLSVMLDGVLWYYVGQVNLFWDEAGDYDMVEFRSNTKVQQKLRNRRATPAIRRKRKDSASTKDMTDSDEEKQRDQLMASSDDLKADQPMLDGVQFRSPTTVRQTPHTTML